MPRLDHRMQLTERFGANERALGLLVLKLVNDVRAAVTPPLAPLTPQDLMRELRQILRAQAQGEG